MDAHLSIFCLPKMAEISMRASVSSFELKIGNFRVKIESRMIPADQMSMAEASATVSVEKLGRTVDRQALTDALIWTFE